MQFLIDFIFWILSAIDFRTSESSFATLAVILVIFGIHFALYTTIPEFYTRAASCNQRDKKKELLRIGALMTRLLNSCAILTISSFAACAAHEIGIRQAIDFLLFAFISINVASLLFIGIVIANKIHNFDKKQIQYLMGFIDAVIYLDNGRVIKGGLFNLSLLKEEPYMLVRLPDGEFTGVDVSRIEMVFLRDSELKSEDLLSSSSHEGAKTLYLKIPVGENKTRNEEFNGVLILESDNFQLIKMIKPTSNSRFVIARKHPVNETTRDKVLV